MQPKLCVAYKAEAVETNDVVYAGYFWQILGSFGKSRVLLLFCRALLFGKSRVLLLFCRGIDADACDCDGDRSS